ncbi:hypothetical protein LEP1GSC188_3094 [Leptospira weilii serovar Topaz str. LT2116]|uniref:Insertion element IS402-like domain-containing protein n=2 Tax=Leptospira weilii TaxID=28184 RepID=M3GVF3_9LEPT|nr:hypothetical protein LEP1GSC188_3094 [Leptospira weilii serovar Topaz str. LT2116]
MITLVIQIKELKATVQELSDTKEIHSSQSEIFKEQSNEIKNEKYERRVFELVNSWNHISDELVFMGYKGDDAFVRMCNEIEKIIEQNMSSDNKKFIRTHLKNQQMISTIYFKVVHNRKIKISERMDLSNDQWKILEPLIIEPNVREDGKGRPRMDARSILNGILWILRTGAQWKELPDRYPPYQTCHRRFQEWNRNGTMRNMIRSLASDLKERGGIDIEESFIDGTFVPAKKGVQKWGKPSVGRIQRSWQSETAKVFLSPFARKMLRPMKSR